MAVFAGHAGPLIAPLILPHSMLAVDLFFMLSGYVIDHAYAHRLETGMSPGRFMLARWIRLYPFYILGGAIGIAGATISLALGQGPFSITALGTAILFTLLMLPSPTWGASAFLMPMNYPAWSLFFEIFVNLVFALVVRWLTNGRLLAICSLSAVWLAYAGIAQGGLHDGAEWLYGWVGFARVLFGFFAGIAIRRLAPRRHIITDWSYCLPSIVLALMTGYGGGIGDVLKTIVIFPLLIMTAASMEPRRPGLFIALGVISYPLYTMQIPVLQFIERALTVLHIDRAAIGPWAGLAIGAGLCIAALILDRLYDQPVRRWLSVRFGGGRPKAAMPAL